MCINGAGILGSRNSTSIFKKLSENAHLLRYPCPSSLRAGGTAAYFNVRLIPRDFGSLAAGHLPSASQILVFRHS